jgi:ATP-dependent Lon protease
VPSNFLGVGYTPEEKLQIARKHLITKRLRESGVAPDSVSITDAALEGVIARYTREAGVRQFSREILPKKNEADLEDVPERVRHEMEFVLAEDMTEVLAAALESERTVPSGQPLVPSSLPSSPTPTSKAGFEA